MKQFYVINFIGMFFLTQWLLILAPFPVEAQMWTRAGRWEIFLFGQEMAGDEARETIRGVNVNTIVDDFAVFGLGVGYNIDDYFGIKLDLFGGTTDLEIERGLVTYKEDTDVSGMDLNFDVNFFKGPFTPFVTGGIGFISFYEDFDDDDTYYYDGYDYSTSFSYNAGVGLRWEVTDHFFLKTLYRSIWSELEDTDETFQFDGFSMFAGYLF